MTTFVTPTEWKSAAWWSNRSPDERLFHARIPRRYLNTSIDFPPDVAAWLASYQPGNNLYIYGKHNSGKSVLSAALLSKMVHSREHPASGRFVPVDTYLDMLKDQFGDSDNLLPDMYSSPFIVKYLQGVFDVVVLDGVGQERETEFSIHEVGSLLRRRYDDMRTVIITTTLPPLAFTRRYGDRVTNIIDNMHTIKVS